MGRSRRKKGQLHYVGGVDELGRPHGRGTETHRSGDVFAGHFCHGEKEGRGTWYFSDGSFLSGRFVSSDIHGLGRYSFADGSVLEAHYLEGQLHGEAREMDHRGDVKFIGHFQNGLKHGMCMETVDDFGGFLFGRVDQYGLWNGNSIAYVYPDGVTAIQGVFSNGTFCSGRLAVFEGSKENCLSAMLCPVEDSRLFRRCISTESVLSQWPLLADPYEERTVYVAASEIVGAGEGLFAKRNIRCGELVAFYNGMRLSHEVVDSRDWTANGNCISLDKETVLDVPKNMSNTLKYCASLGHKANHSFTPNACYSPCEHPYLGTIKCIQAIKMITAGSEVTVDYDYHHDVAGEDTAPEWYLMARNKEFLNGM